MTIGRRFYERLQVAVGPLPEAPVGLHHAARIERFSQIDDKSLPLSL